MNQGVVLPYDPAWPRRYAEIRAVIQRQIAGTYYSVEHVGSTCVPGMAARPIIDIDVVAREGAFERVRQGLEALGYVRERDRGIPGREAFDLQDPGLKSALAPHNLCVCLPDSSALREHRAFRDFLLANPEWVQRLSANKLELARLHAQDGRAYQEAKAPMVDQIMRLALQGAQP